MIGSVQAEIKKVELELKSTKMETAFLNASITRLSAKCGKHTPSQDIESVETVDKEIAELKAKVEQLESKLSLLPFVRRRRQNTSGGANDAATKQAHLDLQGLVQGLIIVQDELRVAKEILQSKTDLRAVYENAVECHAKLIEMLPERERLNAELKKLKELEKVYDKFRPQTTASELPTFYHAFASDYAPYVYLSQAVAAEPRGAFWAGDPSAWKEQLSGTYTVKTVELENDASVYVVDTPDKLNAFVDEFKHVIDGADVGVFDWTRVSEVFDAVVVIMRETPTSESIYTRALLRAFDPPSMAVLNNGVVKVVGEGETFEFETKPDDQKITKFACPVEAPAEATEAVEALVQDMSAEIASKTDLLQSRTKELDDLREMLRSKQSERETQQTAKAELESCQARFRQLLENLRHTPLYRNRARHVLGTDSTASKRPHGGAARGGSPDCLIPYQLSSANIYSQTKYVEVCKMLVDVNDKLEKTVANIDTARTEISKAGQKDVDIMHLRLTCSRIQKDIETAAMHNETEAVLEREGLIAQYNAGMLQLWPSDGSIMAHLSSADDLKCETLTVYTETGAHAWGKPGHGSFWAARFDHTDPVNSPWPIVCHAREYGKHAYAYEVTLDPSNRLCVVTKEEQLLKLIELFPSTIQGRLDWGKMAKFVDAVYITETLFKFGLKLRDPVRGIISAFDIESMVVLNKDPICLGTATEIQWPEGGGGRAPAFRVSTAALVALGLLVTAASSVLTTGARR